MLASLEDQIVPGAEAFKLYDTFGLPLEITRDVAEERGFFVDEAGFQESLAQQREKARSSEKFEMDDQSLAAYHAALRQLQDKGSLGEKGVDHDPYTTTEMETTLVGLLVDGQLVTQAKPGDKVEVILPVTTFYVESGGQVADTGMIVRLPEEAAVQGGGEPLWEIAISEARRPLPGLIVHVGEVKSGRPRVGEPCWALVDYERRWDIMRNHTATHLLHSQLRAVLGTHVQQAGSLVAPDRLRFDFTHSAMLTQDELDTVVENVNDLILANYPVNVHYENYKDARRLRRDGAVWRKVRRRGARHPHGLAGRTTGEPGVVRRDARQHDGRDRPVPRRFGRQRGRGDSPHRSGDRARRARPYSGTAQQAEQRRCVFAVRAGRAGSQSAGHARTVAGRAKGTGARPPRGGAARL